jgi:hypothetical protein
MSETDFYKALAWRESRDDPGIVNSYGFMGLYQMGPAALQDAGYMDSAQRWTGKNGIRSQKDFLESRQAQNIAIREYHWIVWYRYLKPQLPGHLDKIKGIKITQSGLIAAAHLVGTGGLMKFINSKGDVDPEDEIGTHSSEYLSQFGGYQWSGIEP